MKNQNGLQEVLDNAIKKEGILENLWQFSLSNPQALEIESATVVGESKPNSETECQSKSKTVILMEESEKECGANRITLEETTTLQNIKKSTSSLKSQFFESQIINQFMGRLFESPANNERDSKENIHDIEPDVRDEDSQSEIEVEAESLVYLNLRSCDCRFCLLKENLKSASKPKEVMKSFVTGKLKSFFNI